MKLKAFFHALRSLLVLVSLAIAQPLAAGSWRAFHNLTAAQYQSTFNEMSGQGYRLRSLSGYASGGAERYASLWVKESGPEWAARHGMSAADYQKAFDDFGKKGFRLVWVSAHDFGGAARFEGVWEHRSGPPYAAHHNLTAEAYQQAFDAHVKQGFRLLHVSCYTSGGALRYAAIFEKSGGPAWVAHHNMDAAAYQKAFNELGAQGYRIRQVSGCSAGGRDLYAALWEKAGGPPLLARHGVPDAWYQNVFDNAYYQGYTPVFVNAFASGAGGKLSAIWENTSIGGADLAFIQKTMQDYLSKNQVPGAAIAIVKDDRLVFAAGYGYANRETGEEAGPTSLFRIASVSKPVTSTAVLKLIEAGKLHLTDHVFGPGSLLGAQFPTPAANPKLNEITVKHLLEHVSGLSNANGDPMFMNTGMNHAQLISWMINDPGHRMSRDPNTRYEYLNFGYCLLARIIEKVSGKPYEAFARQDVLGPSGIADMVIGANSEAARRPREVKYYGSDAYSINVTRMDGHGGWIASPIDLGKFMARVDGLPAKPDVISAASRTAALTPSLVPDDQGKPAYYGFGWGCGNNAQAHNGAMPGTTAILFKSSKQGFSGAGVANTRPASDVWAGNLNNAIQAIIDHVQAWPSYDLF